MGKFSSGSVSARVSVRVKLRSWYFGVNVVCGGGHHWLSKRDRATLVLLKKMADVHLLQVISRDSSIRFLIARIKYRVLNLT